MPPKVDMIQIRRLGAAFACFVLAIAIYQRVWGTSNLGDGFAALNRQITEKAEAGCELHL